ncbi:MBOAT family O-acyltransferase [Flavihumibacter solisilvae]|uniref:Acyltransferase n=1 Tax=Flavihumibacter solisilvae TaxID=1349421 RepID=A0A0C1L3P2_9BACT|nr:MBOAT family O-acyltransferase [Flavihumibacter solisilvae]KIC94652.1 acyltransferase [Flavihumibacter solisilvae]
MLFNSLNFAFFLPIVFIFYWTLQNKKLAYQNILLLLASYYFYGCWDWRFLFLLAFSTFLDFYTGLKIYHSSDKAKRKFWLILSVGINLGFLGLFKYYNFFADSFASLVHQFGLNADHPTLRIILPVGISFYTFHGMSYVFDIYNRKIKPTTNWVDYSLFVSFFPLLVAGPIERATHLLPQVEQKRTFDYSKLTDGLRQILWGLFKKMVIADNCAEYADIIFNNSDSYSASTLVLGALFFTFQIYCDFSGYSDIALGTARLFGFELLQNFKFPYFSRDIAEFWRRWHVSLSSWFKDYLYIPLGGSKGGLFKQIRNTCIIFLVSGFWHGANWTFVVWGFLNAIYIIPSIVFRTNRQHLEIIAQGRLFPSIKELAQMTLTFSLTVLAWIFFRAETVGHAFDYLSGIFSMSLFTNPFISNPEFIRSILVIALLIPFMIIEWLGRENKYAIETSFLNMPRPVRWAFYSLLVFSIGVFMQTKESAFIYFQF